MGFVDKVKSVAKDADKKIGDSIDKSKYESQIRDEERAIEEVTTEIGKMVVDAIKEGKSVGGLSFDDKMAKIKESESKIEEFKAKIEELKGGSS